MKLSPCSNLHIADSDDAGLIGELADHRGVGAERIGRHGCGHIGLLRTWALIIDPRTDHPSTGTASTTVIGPNLADADAYATTPAVLGIDGLLWLAEREGYCGCVITPDGRLHSTAEFNEFVAR